MNRYSTGLSLNSRETYSITSKWIKLKNKDVEISLKKLPRNYHQKVSTCNVTTNQYIHHQFIILSPLIPKSHNFQAFLFVLLDWTLFCFYCGVTGTTGSRNDLINLSLTLVKISPSRFWPLHVSLFHALLSSIDNPIPQILLVGLASTSVLGKVLNNFVFNPSFCEN